MATFTNNVFKPRKDSGFVVKFRANNKVVEELSHNLYITNHYNNVSFKDTVYFNRTFFTLHGLKSFKNFIPWCYGKDVIAFVYTTDNYDNPYVVFVNNKFIELNSLSDKERDKYLSLSGTYTDPICSLWTDHIV